MNIVFVCIHAPFETKENIKDTFSEDFAQIYDELLRNVIKLVLGHLNIKNERKTYLTPMIERENLHETRDENTLRHIIYSRKRNNNKQHNQ